ncbi:prepilin peptidase [Loktanella sp. Alg231-35]|uniref:prepilin peptidase n=1 Tax=Loktanella sp. Alg231-35 TaxID=1922220 RepID=UPI00131EFC65|nr:A24 family peptidase [Loktanella sp. Alg231-35]
MPPSRISLIALHVTFYAGFAVAGYWHLPFPFAQAFILAALLIWISVVDVERLEIPDVAASLLALTGGAFAYATGSNLIDAISAGIVWPLLFWIVGAGYGKLRGWQGLGFGDVKLMVGIGLWLGFAQTTLVVFTSALSGIAVIALTKLINRQSTADIGTTAVAFGPFLCLSTWVIWLF